MRKITFLVFLILALMAFSKAFSFNPISGGGGYGDMLASSWVDTNGTWSTGSDLKVPSVKGFITWSKAWTQLVAKGGTGIDSSACTTVACVQGGVWYCDNSTKCLRALGDGNATHVLHGDGTWSTP